jgi:hypothetical protein
MGLSRFWAGRGVSQVDIFTAERYSPHQVFTPASVSRATEASCLHHALLPLARPVHINDLRSAAKAEHSTGALKQAQSSSGSSV